MDNNKKKNDDLLSEFQELIHMIGKEVTTKSVLPPIKETQKYWSNEVSEVKTFVTATTENLKNEFDARLKTLSQEIQKHAALMNEIEKAIGSHTGRLEELLPQVPDVLISVRQELEAYHKLRQSIEESRRVILGIQQMLQQLTAEQIQVTEQVTERVQGQLYIVMDEVAGKLINNLRQLTNDLTTIHSLLSASLEKAADTIVNAQSKGNEHLSGMIANLSQSLASHNEKVTKQGQDLRSLLEEADRKMQAIRTSVENIGSISEKRFHEQYQEIQAIQNRQAVLENHLQQVQARLNSLTAFMVWAFLLVLGVVSYIAYAVTR